MTPRGHANATRLHYSGKFSGGSGTINESSSPIRITPRLDWNSYWAWFEIRARLKGKTPSFVINRTAHWNPAGIVAVWGTSTDPNTWTQFDNVTIGATDISFSNNTAFPAGTITICSYYDYPFSRLQTKMGEWTVDSRVANTASTTNFVLGNMTTRSIADGRVCPAMPLYGFHVTNNSGFTKNKMALTAGNHPSETQGMYMLEGFMDWLLAGSAEAETLLDWWDIFVYPNVNPQGRWAGWFRSSPETPGTDHNRLWDLSVTDEAATKLTTAWATDLGTTVQCAIDLHGELSSASAQFISVEDTAQAQAIAYKDQLVKWDSTFYLDALTFNTTLQYRMKNTYGSGIAAATQLAVTQELTVATAKSNSDWKNYGVYIGRSINAMSTSGRFVNGPSDKGSRVFNGTTDRIDWASVFNPVSQAMTISCWAYMDALNASSNNYMLAINQTGDAAYGIVFNVNGANTYISFLASGGTELNHTSSTQTGMTGNWMHLLVTWDGSTTAANAHIYRNGTEVTYSLTTNGATLNAKAGKWSVGGRTYSDTRNWDGNLAQVAVWQRVLSSEEIKRLSQGLAPSALSTNLAFYVPMNTTSLYNIAPDPDVNYDTLDGTTHTTASGPGISYP